MKNEQTNIIDEKEIELDTRRELWNSLFLVVDFSRLKEEYPNMWSKEYKLLPLPGAYKETKEKFTAYCQSLTSKIEALIASYQPYFQANVYPILEGAEGDKTLVFRCNRVFKNKIIAETPLLLLDLLIFERDYLGKVEAKKSWENIKKAGFFPGNQERYQRLLEADLAKLAEGKVNLAVSWTVYYKWANLVENYGDSQGKTIWSVLLKFLKDWEGGKLGKSKWKVKLDKFGEERDKLFELGSESISDGKPFFSTGFIKKDTEMGLVANVWNKKGFNLNNPFLRVVWFHQRVFRMYTVAGYSIHNPYYLTYQLNLKEDWVWGDYPWVVNSCGSLRSESHPTYSGRNLPEGNKQKLHYDFCDELKNNVSLMCPAIDPITKRATGITPFPKLSLFKINTSFASNLLRDFDAPNFSELEGINFIDDLVIEKVHPGINGLNDITEGGAFRAFVAPDDFLTATQKKQNTRNYYYDQIKGTATFAENEGKKWFYEQPRLADHTTFQLFFLDKMLGTYNLSKMDHEIQEGKVIVNYALIVKATPSGILFKFQSREIAPPIRWELKVRGNIITMKALKEAYGWTNEKIKKFSQAAKNLAVKVATFGLGEWKEGEEKKTGYGLQISDQALPGAALQDEKDSGAEQEQQTRRWLQEVGKTSENISDPTLFYTNTTDYHYNFFDFWTRLSEWDRILTARTVFSSDLYNNLKHNNNANPVNYPLNITFQKLGNILRKGSYQGELQLDHDPNGKMTECFARRVTFYESKQEDFPNPDLGLSQQQSTSIYSIGGVGDTYTGQAISEGSEPSIVEVNRVKRNNYHQRAHFFIHYEDGTNEHWLVLFPQSFQDSDLADGHSHAGFTLEFSKPVKSFHDVYTCIGCGASGQGYTVFHSNYDLEGNNYSDSLDVIHKGLPYDPWFSEFTGATLQGNKWMTSSGKCLGASYDVWEQAEEKDSANRTFTKAYGFIPSGGVIKWRLEVAGKTRIEWQKQPNQSDFTDLDWNPPLGGTGETEIPLVGPEVNIPEPGATDPTPEDDLPAPDPFDPTGGESEIPNIEPDPPEPDPNEFDIPTPEVPEPEILPPEVDPPEIDPTKDPDTKDDEPPEKDPFAFDPKDYE